MKAPTQSASARLIAIVADDADAVRPKAADYWFRLRKTVQRRVDSPDRFVRSLIALVRADAISGPCSIPGIEGNFSARDAAFANAALMASEARLPIAAMVAAVAALVEEIHGDDSVAVHAVGFGLGVLDRLEHAAGAGMRARGHFSEGLLGAPAAAAAAGRMIGLSNAAMIDALGVSGSLASGSREWHSGGDLLAGWMARSGILAARLAEEGFSGPAEVFEGRKGLFNGYAGPDQYTTEWLCADAASKPSSTQGHT